MSTLRELTSEAHAGAENTPFMRLFFAGLVTPAEYLQYATNITLIYSALEPIAEQAGLFKDLPGIQRLPNIRKDLTVLQDMVKKPVKIEHSTIRYYNYIIKLSDPQKIMAHVYVRYAGDLYGGQMLKAKAPGPGNWYDFGDNLPGLRGKLRELCVPELADEAIFAFQSTTKIVSDLLNEYPDMYL